VLVSRGTRSKIGLVKAVIHHPLEGKPKTCTVSKSPTGKWYVTFSCGWTPTSLPSEPSVVGIDLGLSTFATLSTGEKIEPPKFFRKEEKALAKGQRRLSKVEKGTRVREARRKVVARVHERIGWRRDNFIHQESRKIVNRFGSIFVEDLSVNRMVHNHCLAKSIMDAAWTGFVDLTSIKAEWAGRKFVKVNPAYTTQDCHKCGHRQKMALDARVYHCPCCGLVECRDVNAAKNILRLGQQSQGTS
jgi:putative transposase